MTRLLQISLFFVWHLSFTQTFQHIENVVGLGEVSHNNGVSVADYDRDGDLDLYIVSLPKEVAGDYTTHSKLFRNNSDGTFTDVTTESGLLNLLNTTELDESYDNFGGLTGYKFGAFWGDYDNDGFPDIFFTHLAKVQLFHNQGDGTFVEVTEAAGITQMNLCNNTGATWFDANNDRFLDLYICSWNGCPYNTFYKNNGDGTFTDVSDGIAENGETYTFSYTAFPFDFDGNGFMDIYVSNDKYDLNQLFLNIDGSTFDQEASNYGLASEDNDMGISIADYNNDGLFDVFDTSINKNFLFKNNGNNTFSETSFENGVNFSGWSWGNIFADFDLDGDEDLFVVNGFYSSGGMGAEENIYFKNLYNNGENRFTVFESGLENNGTSTETLDFDFDNDGDLDVIVTNTDRSSYFYLNNTIIDPQNTEYQWLKVSLEGTVSNRDAIGTILELNTSQGIRKRYYSGVGLLSQSLKPVHFGIDPGASIYALKIKWPSGIEENFENIEPNTHIKITENQGVELLNDVYIYLPQGCTDPNSCNFDALALVDNGTCEYLPTSGSISGPTQTSFFNKDNYTYLLEANQNINWTVDGGEIISGQGTNTIEVQWAFDDTGIIHATIDNGDCISEPLTLQVQLNLTNVGENISIARIWNEALLFAIRNDYARPTVHARNLFHTSAAMYDVWAIFNDSKTYLIGNEVNGFQNTFTSFETDPNTQESDLRKAISYACYKLLSHRFSYSPHLAETQAKFDTIMSQLGYDIAFLDTNYEDGNPAALGNFVANSYIYYGMSDGSRELTQYDNAYYVPLNPPLAPVIAGNPNIIFPNNWQSLSLDTFIDQSGNVIEGETIDFLSPEWGNVRPFALTLDDRIDYYKNGHTYKVYHDPSTPPLLDSQNEVSTNSYLWNFTMVSIWGSHLNPYDGELWDISPKSIGNIDFENFPTSYTELPNFYNYLDGGDLSQGHSINPKTGNPYTPQIVPRGDYTRVLAEFWADGPKSETPPGHWFTILNYVSDNPSFIRKFHGEGEVLSPLEWDVKSYFTLGGAMHDAAITAWSVKGWYDYIRPISAIRYMAGLGQSTNATLDNYHPQGIPLIDGWIEIVEAGDPLAILDSDNIGKIKLFTWKGPAYIDNPATDEAGVGWILADYWWPYQRPSFVTPPFSGYVSGHSTYSRAAAEIMTFITGDAFFPNGMGTFIAKKNEFLVFEEGPSVDVELQWATYRDASDQCSLSRIWGGIHPPADDMPGRIMGEKIGVQAYQKALTYFYPEQTSIETDMQVFPNPVISDNELTITHTTAEQDFYLFDLQGKEIGLELVHHADNQLTKISFQKITPGVYVLISNNIYWKIIVL